MKILLNVQDDPRSDAEFSGRLIDSLRSHNYEVLPYASLLQAEVTTLSRSGSIAERRLERLTRDQIRSCDALIYVQSADLAPSYARNALTMMMSWFITQRRPVIVAIGPDVVADWPASQVDYAFDWEWDEDLHDFVASEKFQQAMSFLEANRTSEPSPSMPA